MTANFFSYMRARAVQKIVLMTFGILLSCMPAAMAQDATVQSDLQPTSFKQWMRDLGYQQQQIYHLSRGKIGCPFVQVEVAGVKLPLMLDTGTARGFVITNHAPEVPHRVMGKTEELNADGSHRGESFEIAVERMAVLGQEFNDVSGTLTDWRMFSSDPLDGTVGLDFFLDRRATLDYKSGKIAVSTLPLPENLSRKHYVYLDLIAGPESHAHVLYARGRVNGKDAIIYFDTGYNKSFIHPQFAGGLRRIVRRGGRFPVFREQVPLELGGRTFTVNEVREDAIQRGAGFELPVAMVLGSDVLSQFVITVDLRAKKLVLAVRD